MQTTINPANVSTHRTELVARDGRPHICVECGKTCFDFIRVHCVYSTSIHNIQYNFPCYWVCNDNCARTIARRDIDGMTFR